MQKENEYSMFQNTNVRWFPRCKNKDNLVCLVHLDINLAYLSISNSKAVSHKARSSFQNWKSFLETETHFKSKI